MADTDLFKIGPNADEPVAVLQTVHFILEKKKGRKEKTVTFLLLVHIENRVEIVVKIEVSGRFAIDFDGASLHLRYFLFSDRYIWLPPISCPAFLFIYLFIYSVFQPP